MANGQTPKAAALYARISRDAEGDGLGVARQERECRALAKRLGWTVAEVYSDDDISAYKARSRPGYDRMLADLSAGRRDGLLAWHPDRLHRRPIELEHFIGVIEERAIPIATVTAGDVDLGTSNGRMIARITGAVARQESEHKAERQRSKHVELAMAGKPGGGGYRPFGYSADWLHLNSEEAELLREAARRVLAGETTWGVAHDWNARGIKTSTEGQWRGDHLARILTAPRVAGLRSRHGEVVADAAWPAILDRMSWERLRATISGPRRAQRPARSHLLSGWLRCDACVARMRGRPLADGRRRYVCAREAGGCAKVAIMADPLEELVVEMVLLRVDTSEMARALVGDDKPGAEATRELVEVEAQLEDLAEMWAGNEIDRAEWLAARRALHERRDAAQAALAHDRSATALQGYAGRTGALRSKWPGLSLDQQRAVLGAVVAEVKVAPTLVRGRGFDPNRVKVLWRL